MDERLGRYSICYAGTYERDYPRNRLLVNALRAAGAHVEEAHVPVFERWQDKSGRSPVQLAGLAVRIALAELRLLPEVALRLLRCQALATGYLGQIDTLTLAPLARLMGRAVLINPMITLTDTVVEDRQLVAAGSLPARLLWRIDRWTLSLADLVIVDTEANGCYLTERFGIPQAKIEVIPVGANEDIFYSAPNRDASETLDVLFYGKFIPLHGIDTIMRAARIVAERDATIRFTIIGRGQEYSRIRGLAARLEISNVEWVDWVSFEELGDRIRRADVVLGIFDGGAKAGRVIPNKMHQALACGVATVTRESRAMQAIADAGGMLAVPAEDPEALARAILELRDRERRAEIAQAGRRAWEVAASSAALAQGAGRVVERLRSIRRRRAAQAG